VTYHELDHLSGHVSGHLSGHVSGRLSSHVFRRLTGSLSRHVRSRYLRDTAAPESPLAAVRTEVFDVVEPKP